MRVRDDIPRSRHKLVSGAAEAELRQHRGQEPQAPGLPDLPADGRGDTQRNGKFVTAMRPLFPGYIFVAFDAARGFWRTVNSTYGITRLVSFGKEPTAVPLDLVSQLMLRCDAKGKMLPPKLLKPGDQVTLTKGPFANFVAEVEKIAPDRRVWVLMEIMGAQTRVAVGADQLRSV